MNIRLLVVDDSVEILNSLSDFLMEEGYEVLTASNGVEALELLELTQVSLIITDLMMPKMGGFEFVERCRKTSPFNQIPIIMMSTKDISSTQNIISELGINGFLAKPVNPDLLRMMINSSLSCQVERIRSIEFENKFENRRAHKRVPYFCEATIIDKDFFNATTPTMITSLSCGGCSIESPLAIPVGSVITMQIALLPYYTLEVCGEVRYSISKSNTGIQFSDLDPKDRELINDIVSNIAKIEKVFELEYRYRTDTLIDKIDDAVYSLSKPC
ncbi:MAG: response regulator [Blastocatellia bacterium]|nr:response regulator [Blastocatellia bacterium]